MRTTRLLGSLTSTAILATQACGGKTGSTTKTAEAPPPAIAYEANVAAGGAVPPAGTITMPPHDEQSAANGATLFSSMNCDGCHGGGATGWVGPSLVDGRWRYGGADEEVFTSIYYGRPKGMPAYGGVIGTDGIWMIVAYLKAQPVPSVVPTVSWLPGGNATAQAAPPAPPPSPPAPAGSIPPDQMIVKYGCTACHAIDHKVIGPSYDDVAAKYRGQNVEATLVAKVRNGGAGNWGHIPMTPNPQVPTKDLQAIVSWILTLK